MNTFVLIKGLIEGFFTIILSLTMGLIAICIYILTFISTRHRNVIREAWLVPPYELVDAFAYGRHRFETVNVSVFGTKEYCNIFTLLFCC